MPLNDRLELHAILQGLLENGAVYFQPPSDVSLVYPCFIYNVRPSTSFRADNNNYATRTKYDVMLVYKNPDYGLDMINKVLIACPGSAHDRSWRIDNLYHENFIVW